MRIDSLICPKSGRKGVGKVDAWNVSKVLERLHE
jgi:hypothetical protein